MFWAIVLSIIRRIRLYNAACDMKHPMSCRPVVWQRRNTVPPLPDNRPTTHWVLHITSCIIQSNSPDDGQNYCPKHVALILIC